MDTIAKFIIPGITFLLTLVFGVWLSRSGKPYNNILFNIHKLVALGTVIVLVVQLANLLIITDPQALIILLLILAGVGVGALFASGALMSVGKLDYVRMHTIHRSGLLVMAIAMILVVYLLGQKL